MNYEQVKQIIVYVFPSTAMANISLIYTNSRTDLGFVCHLVSSGNKWLERHPVFKLTTLKPRTAITVMLIILYADENSIFTVYIALCGFHLSKL